MHFYSVKHDLHVYFAAILNTLQRYFSNDPKNHHINIFEISFNLKTNQDGFSTFVRGLKSIELILRLKQRFVLAPCFGYFIKRKTAL